MGSQQARDPFQGTSTRGNGPQRKSERENHVQDTTGQRKMEGSASRTAVRAARWRRARPTFASCTDTGKDVGSGGTCRQRRRLQAAREPDSLKALAGAGGLAPGDWLRVDPVEPEVSVLAAWDHRAQQAGSMEQVDMSETPAGRRDMQSRRVAKGPHNRPGRVGQGTSGVAIVRGERQPRGQRKSEGTTG